MIQYAYIEKDNPMQNSLYAYQHYLLRSIAVQMKLPETKQVALRPGVQSVYRVTCFHAGNAPSSVATLVSTVATGPTLMIRRENTPIAEEYPVEDWQRKALYTAFSSLKFDKLPDQPGIPTQGVTLWLVERSAGSFLKSVLVAPQLATDKYQTLVFRLHELMPQAVEPLGE